MPPTTSMYHLQQLRMQLMKDLPVLRQTLAELRAIDDGGVDDRDLRARTVSARERTVALTEQCEEAVRELDEEITNRSVLAKLQPIESRLRTIEARLGARGKSDLPF